jgi:hypothetical protein
MRDHHACQRCGRHTCFGELLAGRPALRVVRQQLPELRHRPHVHVDVAAEPRVDQQVAARMAHQDRRHRERALVARRAAAIREHRTRADAAGVDRGDRHARGRRSGRQRAGERRRRRQRRRQERPYQSARCNQHDQQEYAQQSLDHDALRRSAERADRRSAWRRELRGRTAVRSLAART